MHRMTVRTIVHVRKRRYTGWYRPEGAIGAPFVSMVRDYSERKVWNHLLARLPPGDKCVTRGDADQNVPYPANPDNTTPLSP
jgi:hypothetical protein